MHIHIRVRRWVGWWFYLGLACGIFALTNIYLRHLSRAEDILILLLGALHWVLGGFLCYALDGIRVRKPEKSEAPVRSAAGFQLEWHPASDFLLPGNHRSILLPPRYHGPHGPVPR